MDRNWALTPFFDGAKILQPSILVAGAKDPVTEFHNHEFDVLETNVPNLRGKVLIPGAGHWTQQECPEDVTLLLLEFLNSL
jgi:pimeloyl-ACP methyl ester carboxylesterase